MNRPRDREAIRQLKPIKELEGRDGEGDDSRPARFEVRVWIPAFAGITSLRRQGRGHERP
jgi:hypothetical protein